MAIEAKIEGNKLIITCDLEKPTPSASGKTLVVVSTRGNLKTACLVEGKPHFHTKFRKVPRANPSIVISYRGMIDVGMEVSGRPPTRIA